MHPRPGAASAARSRGVGFVLARQGDDGFWRDFHTPAGEASEWPTAAIAVALRLAGAGTEPLERAARALVAHQNTDGGWGYNEDVPTDADSTAWSLVFLGASGRWKEPCRRAAARLADHQRPDTGGVATYAEPGPIRDFMGAPRWVRFRGWCRPHTEVTATAGRALMAVDHPAAEAAWRFVRAQQRRDGSWASYWWTSPLYATLQAAELAVAFGDAAAAGRAAEWVAGSRASDGVPPGAFATALSLSILLRGGASGRHVDAAARTLVALQDDDGGWPSEPIMRVPLPGNVDPQRWRPVRVAGGIVVRDQHRTFTTAACIAALALAQQAAD